MIKHYLAVMFILSFLLGTSSCSKDSSSLDPIEKTSFEQYFPIHLGSKKLEVQVAVTPWEIERGLMFRKKLGKDQGMLFIHRQIGQMNYWMRNVSIPLSIGFFDSNGILKEIYPMYPYEETPVASANSSIQFALEVNNGWFFKNGIEPNMDLSLDEIKYLLKKRGFKPEAFLRIKE